MFGAGESFGHDLGEVGEGAGGFDVEIAEGHGKVEAAEGSGERGVGDEIGGQAGGDFFAGFDGVIDLIGVPLVKITELSGFVFLEHAALAAVGEEERAQGRAVLGGFRGHGNLQNLSFGNLAGGSDSAKRTSLQQKCGGCVLVCQDKNRLRRGQARKQ